MPTLHLRVSPLQNPDRYAVLAQGLTDLTVSILRKRREVTSVVIDDIPPARWYVGGRMVHQPIAWLEVDITQHTNTEAEKADFIAQAWGLLRQHLALGASLAQASYVTLRELPASDWGYDGQTQAHRRMPAAA